MKVVTILLGVSNDMTLTLSLADSDNDEENDSMPEDEGEEEEGEQEEPSSEDEASNAVEDQDESKAITTDEIPQGTTGRGSIDMVLMLCIDVDVSAWESFQLAEPIMDALKYHKFTQPTPIQQKTLGLALKGRHIVGAAETVSDFIPYR